MVCLSIIKRVILSVTCVKLQSALIKELLLFYRFLKLKRLGFYFHFTHALFFMENS